MTTQAEVANDPNYIACLDHGFVGLVDHMGDDHAIDQAARVSYGLGTRSKSDTRALLRYLMRNRHTSPFEMGEIKFHLRMPIAVARQLIRHRTANLNEYSGRYSVLADEFYVPELDDILPQSIINKQGRDGNFSKEKQQTVVATIKDAYKFSYDAYVSLLEESVDEDNVIIPGVAREIARMVLPVGVYTELYWKMDLHNIFHLLGLRLDKHAQKETRVFAEAMYSLVKLLFPLASEAFEDYKLHAYTLSRMEVVFFKDLIRNASSLAGLSPRAIINVAMKVSGDSTIEDVMVKDYGMSKREAREFLEHFLPK